MGFGEAFLGSIFDGTVAGVWWGRPKMVEINYIFPKMTDNLDDFKKVRKILKILVFFYGRQ